MKIFRGNRSSSGCISVIAIGIIILVLTSVSLLAHDKHYAVTQDQKKWFDGLKSGKGPCCSDADGTALSDVDWDVLNGNYRVRIEGRWIDVPDEAVLKQPNLYGPTMVWPIPMNGYDPPFAIRCFIVGTMT